jgi:ATP-binding cassette subfamily B protein
MAQRLRYVRQRDAMQCGVASLSMICSLMGHHYGVTTLEHFCFPTNEGLSLKGIAEAAEALGLNPIGVRVTLQELRQSEAPAILHWNQNHFVVFYGVTRRGRYRIADPGKGCYTCSAEEMDAHWISCRSQGADKGIAMFFEPTDEFGTKVEELPDRGHSVRFLMSYINRYRQYFLIIAVGLLLGSVLQLLMPFLTQWIVDIGIKHRDIHFIWLVLIGELCIVLGKTANDFVRRWLLLHISMRINISLVSDFFIKLLRLPMDFFDTKLTGDLLQRMSDHSRVQTFLTQQTLGIAFSIMNIVVFGLVLLIYNRLIFLVFIVASVIYAVWVVMFLHRRKVLDYEMFEVQSSSQNKTYQFITTMQEIKLQNCECRRRHEWEDVQADMFEVQMKSLKMQQTQEAGSIIINEVKNIFITVFAATAVINGEITLGAMLAVQYIVGQLNSPIDQLMSFLYSMQDVKISLDRINEIHQRPDEDDGRCGVVSRVDGGNSIAVRNIGFRYDRHSPKLIIKGVSLQIAPGKVTAIVGASGSGKTTLIKLMLGYYRPETGDILVNGTDLATLNLRQWRQRCGVVMQDGVIFSESIARNIAIDDAEIDDRRLHEAAQIACIHDFIVTLPLGYNTQVGHDGLSLSQGQKQRILIARAVYRNPDFIFLDEATNSLDATNERAIVENLARFYRNRTVVIVAHRLSTVRHADNIAVIDAGQLIEQGTHEQLVALRGTYFRLIKNQLELGT